MTNEEMAQLNEAVAKSFPHDGDIRIAIEAGAAALRREPQESVVDAAVTTAMYRKFKEWSARGFTADDVTWCEVKAEILKVVRFEISRQQCKPIEVVASYEPQPTQEP